MCLWSVSQECCERQGWWSSHSKVTLRRPKHTLCIKLRWQIIFQQETKHRFLFKKKKIKITLIITLWRLSPNHGRSNVRVRIHRQGCWGVQMRPPVVKKVRACHPHVRESLKVIRGCCWIDGGCWGKVGDHRMNKCSISWSVLYQQPWLEIITLRNDEELEGKVTT